MGAIGEWGNAVIFFLLSEKVVQPLIGTFVGAYVAYRANARNEERKKKVLQLGAGNMAMAILCEQYSNFVIAAAGIKHERDENKSMPIWWQVANTLMAFPENLSLGPEQISFALEEGDIALYKRLVTANSLYHDFRYLLEKYKDAVIRRNEAYVEKVESKITGQVNPDVVAGLLGTNLIEEMTAFTTALYRRVDSDGEDYRITGELLETFLLKRHKKAKIMPFQTIGVSDKGKAAAGILAAQTQN